MKNSNYILITAAKNEESFIEQTILAVVKQTIKPVKWIIADDGSTDHTEEIVKRYSSEYSFIQLLKITDGNERNFASKVNAINKAISVLKNIDYDFLGILDADITFKPDYYEKIINEFSKDPKLGLAGGQQYDIYDSKLHKVINSENSIGNSIQFFRRECFEKIGGLTPIAKGGEDGVAEVSVRYYGWKVKVINGTPFYHNRRTGLSSLSYLHFRFTQGEVEYILGYHPVFQFMKCMYRIKEKPYVIGSIFRFTGFWMAAVKRIKRPVSAEFVRFIRKEQINRLSHSFHFSSK